MKSIAVGLVLMIVAPPAAGPLDRLRAKVSVVSASDAAGGLAGKYSSAHPDLLEGHLRLHSGRTLYLFPDQTYVYCEWGDLLDETVYDKGKWRVHDGQIKLNSDPDVTWSERGQRVYVVVRRLNRPAEVLLVGVDWDLPQLEASEASRAEFRLLLHSYLRLEHLDRTTSVLVKRDLLRRAWNPSFFTSAEP